MGTALAVARDPRGVGVTFRSTLSPAYTTYPLSPSAAQRRAPPRNSWGALVMSAIRPSVEVSAGAESWVVEPYGDPEALPIGKAVAALTFVGTGLALYGAYKLARQLLG